MAQQMSPQVDPPPVISSVHGFRADLPLSGPGASESRRMPNGQHQEPGGWNRNGNPVELFEPAQRS
jgi:hypothetical protein